MKATFFISLIIALTSCATTSNSNKTTWTDYQQTLATVTYEDFLFVEQQYRVATAKCFAEKIVMILEHQKCPIPSEPITISFEAKQCLINKMNQNKAMTYINSAAIECVNQVASTPRISSKE
jgi:D-lyxose ketol-isomerase